MWNIKRKSYTNNWHNIFRNSHYFVSLLFFVTFLPFILINNTSAATYTASLSTSGVLSVDATSNGSGTSVGVDTLTVNSTCPVGYNITIEGPSDTNLYLNGNSANNANGTYIAHSTGTPSNPVPITGNNLGTWGYSTTSSTGSGNFIGLTNTATTLTSKNSASASGGDTIPVYYGVSVPTGLTPGTYQMPGTSAITYYLTRSDNCVSYLVSFNANGGSGTAMPDQRIYEDQATELSANTYTAPSGKFFKEWNTAANGSGTSYSDGQSVTNIASVGTTLTLYAQWAIYMQDMDFSQCTTTPMTVYDKRDMQEYTVAKLADGNCWMTKNLNIAGGTELSSTDTDFDSSYTLPTTNGWTTSGGKLVLPPNSQSIQAFGLGDINKAVLLNTGKEECGQDPINGLCYSYYSWDAATLGSGRYMNTTGLLDTPYSICPKGWNLPSLKAQGSKSDYGTLQLTYSPTLSSNELMAQIGPNTVANFVLNGRALKGQYDQISAGHYWSSTPADDERAYFFAIPFVLQSGLPTGPYAINVRAAGRGVRCIKRDPSLYRKVEKMSKGTQTNDTDTVTGIKVNPTVSNSGVYEYDSSVFGPDTDGVKSDNTKAKIYYYRGILDSYNYTGSYGSSSASDAYPNYVILQAGNSKATTDTCWRIIRTTGSGGVKMIYNGLWTGSTCANATTSAMISSPVSTSTFNGTANTDSIARQVVRVGYTHNSTYASTSSTSSTAYATVMGSNSNYSVNNTDSTIKGNIETWYNNTISGFESLLEPNAGYCNDRYSYTTATGTTATSNIRPYTTSTSTGATYVAYFAGSQRNAQTTKTPSLGCPRSTVDVYSTDTSKGGNGQLNAPVGLITADEASFAGSGRSVADQGSGYSTSSFLRNGSTFWTMTPYQRSGSYSYGFYMDTDGYIRDGRIDSAQGIRPVISLKEGTLVTSGTGIVTDPWVITIPEENSDPIPDSQTHTVSYEGTTIPGYQLDFYVNDSYYDSIISPTESRHTSGTLPLNDGDILQLIFDGYDVYVDDQMVYSGDEFVIQGDMEITFE